MPRIHQDNDNTERVLLRYHGGKARLAKWICHLLPSHEYYVEAYGGGASVLLNKPRNDAVLSETYNDIDHDVVNLFECLSDDAIAPHLINRLRLTPYAREAWQRAYTELQHLDAMERARTLCVRVMMGWGSKGLNPDAKVVFRANDAESTGYANDWTNYVEGLPRIVARLRGVHIECLPALQLIQRSDKATTLLYLDPPYLLAGGDKTYTYDMDYSQHEALLLELQKVQSMVLLSGYPHELYTRLLDGWWLFTQDNYTDSHAKRQDCLWMNDWAGNNLHHLLAGPKSEGAVRVAAPKPRRAARVALVR